MAVSTGAALAGGALLGSGILGGSQQNNRTATQVSAPWGPIQPFVLDVANKAQSLYNRGPFNYLNVSPATQQAERLIAQRAVSPGSLINRSQGVIGDTLSGRYLTPDSNPYFRDYVDQALGQAKSAFAGQYGGFAGSNLNNSGYQEALAKNLGQVATNAYANLYNTERQNQLSASQLAPGLDFANLQALAGVGGTQDLRSQQQYYAPFTDLARYQSALTPGLGFGTTTATTPYYTNPLSGALGGALAGGQLAGLFGGSAPAAAAGAGTLFSPAALLAGGMIPL